MLKRKKPVQRAGVAALSMAALLVVGTAAEARPDLRKMTCGQAQAMVKRNGGVVFTTGTHTYSLFVSNYSYCDPGEQLFTQFGPTRDNPKCPVAYECREPLFERGGFRRW
ncbi:hypothetical protein [Roseibium polysiphoniae]|uniref:Secreted protein n=1 Tax=Roseibium polysiphoniae TaxID=2571221 RepID=A0ABR9C726_9HYPH|nr:hypothetical protein [Roseibium polysiphoniae]MBD8875398.1 hypothetical protein [Roseibium polysiphoniae]